MWLLDVNLPNGLVELLTEFGIRSETTVERGWRDLDNGDLAGIAVEAGFIAILTRDKLFGESAGRALKKFPSLAVVIIEIPQSRQESYLRAFRDEWQKSKIDPTPGEVIRWPTGYQMATKV
ncbi:MAG: hypothetical protein COV44_02325 [Deltaproteobacteria bacterium CG11_big_fil_rev_8_21_14_0_20_45_16]|nr:MAG: hypothetical protein COV44_02325 [Deltaproteobacteria bacterium CG11_big_fil_rev_8_21_14_0_20_45_16]